MSTPAFLAPKAPVMLHGADYNLEQWLDFPDVLKEDIRLMKLSNMNVMHLGIFPWLKLEPEEGKFDFSWLDKVMDSLFENGIFTVLATPSGARPAWMAEKYPEVLRVNGIRQCRLFSIFFSKRLTFAWSILIFFLITIKYPVRFAS